ncbi:MAG: hypothetical protein KF774_09765 [Planctomyces sp.]|nr:hypothetical protein [Planctomyces sp.]
MTASSPAAIPAPAGPWLFSRTIDLWTFGGSAALSLLLLAIGWRLGILHSDSPEWTWIACVLLVDVAHVYATGFRVYFDRDELRRRPGLYYGVPLAAFGLGWAVHSESPAMYWRLLAYLAVLHFIRQQYGWVMLYRARAGETDTWGRRLDAATIYIATLHPLACWHASLPRRFDWLIAGDFAALPAWAADVTDVLWAGLLPAYFLRSLVRGVRFRFWNPGKDLVVATTALLWYLGIVVLNSDFAFTVTNVLIHGIPYLVLLYLYWTRSTSGQGRSVWSSAIIFLSTVWLLAYVEELLWDRGVWREREHLFTRQAVGNPGGVLAPLLGVPQLTHYILDGFLWKRRTNRRFNDEFAAPDEGFASRLSRDASMATAAELPHAGSSSRDDR